MNAVREHTFMKQKQNAWKKNCLKNAENKRELLEIKNRKIEIKIQQKGWKIKLISQKVEQKNIEGRRKEN